MSGKDLFDLEDSEPTTNSSRTPTENLKNFIFGKNGYSEDRDLEEIKEFLDEGADPNKTTILHQGLKLTGSEGSEIPVLSNSQCIRLIEMISKKGSLETRDSVDRQPIHYAVERLINGHTRIDESGSGEDVVKALLPEKIVKKGRRSSVKRAPINVHDTNNITPLYLAIEADNIDVAILLIAHNASPKSDRGPLLLTAVKKKNKDMVQLLLKNGANPNSMTELGDINDEYQESPLSFAVTNKNIDIVNLLLRYGALPYFRHAKGQMVRYLPSWCSARPGSPPVRVKGKDYKILSVGLPNKKNFLETATIYLLSQSDNTTTTTTMENISIIGERLVYPIDVPTQKNYQSDPSLGHEKFINSFATIKSIKGNTLISHACNLGRIDIAILLLNSVYLYIGDQRSPYPLEMMKSGADPYIRWACEKVPKDEVESLIRRFHFKMPVKGHVAVPQLSHGPAQLNMSERVMEAKNRLGSSHVEEEVNKIQKLFRGLQGRKRTKKQKASLAAKRRREAKQTKKTVARTAEGPAAGLRRSRRLQNK